MKTETKKIALFKNIENDYISMTESWADTSPAFVRISEYVDVEFKMLPVSERINDLMLLAKKEKEMAEEKYQALLDEIKVQS